MTDKRGRLKGQLRFDAGDASGKLPALGALAEYRPIRDKATGEAMIGAKRIARLRATETQRIAHRMNYWAGRIALQTRLDATWREVEVRLKPREGTVSPEVRGEAMRIDGNDEAVEVPTARFRELCQLLPAFAELDSEAAGCGERFNLKGILDQPRMKERFVLQLAGQIFEVRERQQPSAGRAFGPGNAEADQSAAPRAGPGRDTTD